MRGLGAQQGKSRARPGRPSEDFVIIRGALGSHLGGRVKVRRSMSPSALQISPARQWGPDRTGAARRGRWLARAGPWAGRRGPGRHAAVTPAASGGRSVGAGRTGSARGWVTRRDTAAHLAGDWMGGGGVGWLWCACTQTPTCDVLLPSEKGEPRGNHGLTSKDRVRG